MVFVPATRAVARSLRDGVSAAGLVAYTSTLALQRALGSDYAADEVDYAALSYAGIAVLLDTERHPTGRLVLAAEVDGDQVTTSEDPYGRVVVDGLQWPQVTALFGDSPAAMNLFRTLGDSVWSSLDEALNDPTLVELFDEHDLLWFDPTELDRLL